MVVLESNMALDTVALGIYVYNFRSDRYVYCDARTQSGAACRCAPAANLDPSNRRVWAGVRRVGVDVPRDSSGHRIFPPAFVGWFSAPLNRFDSLSDFALEDGSAANGFALAHVVHYGFLIAWCRQRRRVSGRAHRSFGCHRVAGGDCFALDGHRGLAAAGRHEAWGARCGWIAPGLQRFGVASGTKESWRLWTGRSIRSWPSAGCFVGVGMRVGLLQTFRRACGIRFDGNSDAMSCGRSFPVDREYSREKLVRCT